jgi:cytochrome c oxidase assembly protein subunit 15
MSSQTQQTYAHPPKAIAIWLFFSAFLVLLMIVIGGITRLTDSGLSIVEWKPIAGILPPLTLQDWQNLFAQYQNSPEFIQLHPDMNLDEFKNIFWWEYFHRVLGRIIGIVFLIPFIFFALRKKISKKLLPHLLILFVLGGAQGYMGWYMVQSGLVDDPYVSPIRLMLHLGLALIIYTYMITLAIKIIAPNCVMDEMTRKKLKLRGHIALALTGFTILSGALVAGLDAGLIYNTFPLMNGAWIPDDYAAQSPFYLNLFHNPANAQFNHRVLAILTFLFICYFWASSLKVQTPKKIKILQNLMLVFVCLQVLLGILTLIFVVPIPLAVLHQLNAIVLFTIVLLLFVTIPRRRISIEHN